MPLGLHCDFPLVHEKVTHNGQQLLRVEEDPSAVWAGGEKVRRRSGAGLLDGSVSH